MPTPPAKDKPRPSRKKKKLGPERKRFGALASAAELVPSVLSRALEPDPYQTISEWSDKNRILSSQSSGEPGLWRTSRTPYLKAIMDSLSPGSRFERVVFMKGAQVGATEMGLNWLGYIIDKMPGPTLVVAPTVDMAKAQTKTRLDPMIAACPALAAKISEPRSRDGSNTMMLKEFPGGFIGMTGANSGASLRSKPIKYLMLDEVDAYPGNVSGEGDPVNLALARTRTFPGRRIFLASTPTVSGRSRIEKAYNESDKRRFYVPCPRCGGYQVLQWPRVKWDPGNPRDAWYECEHCGGRIENWEKESMLPKGEWRSEVPEYQGIVAGFYLSSLYSPVGWFSWGEAASMFLEAKKNVELLRVFVNTVLGECWEERGDAPEWERLYLNREEYEMGRVPTGGLLLTAGADVQQDRIEVLIRAWGRGMENWIIDHRVFMGNTADLGSEPWHRLDELMSESFEHEIGANLHISSLALDTGYNTQQCYAWARRYQAPRVMPVKGQQSLAVIVSQPKAVDVAIDGKRKSAALKLFNVGVSLLKSELYAWLRLPHPGPGEAVPVGYCHLPDRDEEWFKQLCSETLVEHQVKGGRTVYEWVQIRPRNEVLDMMVYSRAAAALCNVDKFTSAHWDRLEEAVIGHVTPRQQPRQQPQNQPAPKPSDRIVKRRRGIISGGISL